MFYRELMTEEAVMILVNGMVLDSSRAARTRQRSSTQRPPSGRGKECHSSPHGEPLVIVDFEPLSANLLR